MKAIIYWEIMDEQKMPSWENISWKLTFKRTKEMEYFVYYAYILYKNSVVSIKCPPTGYFNFQ